MTDPFHSAGAKAPPKPYSHSEGRREIRSFVLRQGRFTPAQQRAFDQAWPRFGLDYAGTPRDLDAVFGRSAPKVLEIGFGNGEAFRFSAQRDPARDHIGIEVHAPGVGRLLNALAGDDIAIVTDIAGTTRDTVREQITLDGVPVHIIDTAGLRDTDDVVEKIGIERSHKAVQEADVALILIDPREGINAKTRAILQSLPAGLKKIEIHNKIDLSGEAAAMLSDGIQTASGADTLIKLSAKQHQGLDLLKQALLAEIGWQGESESLFLARSRHLNALHSAQFELENAALCSNTQIELLAEHLRLAQLSCSEITGEFSADDLLGVIFSRFCIGK